MIKVSVYNKCIYLSILIINQKHKQQNVNHRQYGMQLNLTALSGTDALDIPRQLTPSSNRMELHIF